MVAEWDQVLLPRYEGGVTFVIKTITLDWNVLIVLIVTELTRRDEAKSFPGRQQPAPAPPTLVWLKVSPAQSSGPVVTLVV